MGEDCFPLRQAACTTARHRKTAAQQNLVRHGQGGTEYVHNTDGRGKKGHYYATNENRGRKGAHGRGGNPQSGCKGAGHYSLQQEP